MSYDCDGCGQGGDTIPRWLTGPYGLTCVHVHDEATCAEKAKEGRRAYRFVRLGPAQGVIPRAFRDLCMPPDGETDG